MAGAERVFRAPGAIIGGGRVLPSPAAFYLTGEDNLRIVSANSATGVSIKVNWRHAEPNGETKPDSQTHTPNTNRTVKTEDFPLGAGSLLNVTVFAGAGAPRIGQTFVMVQLVRGAGAAAIVLGTLLAGNITTTQALGWPGSPIVVSTAAEPVVRNIDGTTPAVGAQILETCPTGARWELISVYFRLSTSAAAGNRNLYVSILSGGVEFGQYGPGINIGPSVSQRFVYGQNLQAFGITAPVVQYMDFPLRMFLLAGDTFGTQLINGQAGDSYTEAFYQVREWLEVG